jgi:hypothetical protein
LPEGSQGKAKARYIDTELHAPGCELTMKREHLREIMVSAEQEVFLKLRFIDEREKLMPEHCVENSDIEHTDIRQRLDAFKKLRTACSFDGT